MKLLSISARDVDFLHYRKDVSELFVKKGLKVSVACEVTDPENINKMGAFKVQNIRFVRGSLNPLQILRELLSLRQLIKENRPDVYISYSFKLSLLTAVASFGMRLKRIHVLTGLGYMFTSDSTKARFLKFVAIRSGRLLFKKHPLLVLNKLDYDVVVTNNISNHLFQVHGEGINPERLRSFEEVPYPFQITYVGRMLRDKGVMKLIAIGEILKSMHINFQINLVGERDPENPESLNDNEWRRLEASSFIKLRGYQNDIESVWKKSHLCILLSEREGLPQSLLEAIVCKRVVIASDIPACREIIDNNVGGFLISQASVELAAEKILQLYKYPETRHSFVEAALDNLKRKFTAEKVAEEYLKIIGD